MSTQEISTALLDIDEVVKCLVDRAAVLHGEPATRVVATLLDGRTVEGIFTTQDKKGFGGVEFSSRKDIPALMRAKVLSVLDGTAEV